MREKYITLIKQTSNKSSPISVAKHAAKERKRVEWVYASERKSSATTTTTKQVAAGRRGLHATDGCNRSVVVAVCNKGESRENNKTQRVPRATANSRGRKLASGKTAKLTGCGQFVFNYVDVRAEG